jgi:hypothetical protein
MAYIDKAKELGREPLNIAELELDQCSLTFGTAPCTAIGEKCFNTIGTCKDLTNYTASSKNYVFTDKNIYAPVGLRAFPAIEKVTYSPTKLEFGKGLGYRSKVSIKMQDFKHHDRGIDPYQDSRTYDTSRGTFFRKMIARNKYYNGRPVRVLTGYNAERNERMTPLVPTSTLVPSASLLPGKFVFTDDTVNFFSQDDFETRSFIIEKIELNQDTITVTGKDILKKLDKDRAQVPVQSSGVLKADITSSATSLTLTDDSYADYPVSGYVRINDEIMSYTSKVLPDTLNGLTRAQYGTTADSHSTDDGVQSCKVYTSENVVDIIYDILVNYGDIPSSYIPYDNGATGTDDEWDTEKSTFLSYANYSTIISEPEGADKLLEELTEQSMLMLWWDDKNQKIRLKALTPPTQRTKVAVLNEQSNFIEGSIRYKINDGDRYSQLWIRYFPKDWSQMKDPTDFGAVYVGANLDSEAEDRYGDKRVKTINSRWFATSSQPATLYTRFAQLYTDAPTEFKAKLDAKDSYLQIGDFVDIISSYVVDANGADTTLRTFITEIKDTVPGHEIEITALSTGFVLGQRYAYVAPNAQADYTSASDAEKGLYGFIAADATGFPSDDGDSYKII